VPPDLRVHTAGDSLSMLSHGTGLHWPVGHILNSTQVLPILLVLRVPFGNSILVLFLLL